MARTAGKVLYILGFLCLGWFVLVGGSFSGIYLMGFIGTGGREAGGELAFMVVATLVGAGVGWLLIRVGSRLSRPPGD